MYNIIEAIILNEKCKDKHVLLGTTHPNDSNK
jgi:hypothetical protein